jgi:hypothetical protein
MLVSPSGLIGAKKPDFKNRPKILQKSAILGVLKKSVFALYGRFSSK